MLCYVKLRIISANSNENNNIENQIATPFFFFWSSSRVSIIAFCLLFYTFKIEREMRQIYCHILWLRRVERKGFKICKKD